MLRPNERRLEKLANSSKPKKKAQPQMPIEGESVDYFGLPRPIAAIVSLFSRRKA